MTLERKSRPTALTLCSERSACSSGRSLLGWTPLTTCPGLRAWPLFVPHICDAGRGQREPGLERPL